MDMCSSLTIQVSSGRCERRPRSRCSGRSRRGRMGALINWAVLLALAVGFSVLAGSAALAERRVALVIGNANYDRGGVLWNTINDAKAIAALLSDAGFDLVDQRSNLGVVEFKRAVREFVDRSANADVAVVYYSGHGLEVGGVNYLIPVDAKLMSSLDVDDEAVSLDRLLVATERVKKLSLIILDACRKNPFHPVNGEVRVTRAGSTGLASVTPTVADTLVAFAAKAGSVSYDGDGPDSPFTTALVKYLAQPGLDIRRALGKVRDEVLRETGNRQEPYVYGSLGGEDIALVPAKPAAAAAMAVPPSGEDVALVPAKPAAGAAMAVPPTSVDFDEAVDYRLAERVGSLEGWRAFLVAHPSGFFAQLARAQIEKMLPPGTASASAPAGAAYVRGPSNTQPAAGGIGRAASAASATAATALAPSEICKRDSDRLARLRGNPSAEEAQHFETELSCEILRPQFLRLMESLGLAAAAPSAPANPSPSDSSLPGPRLAGDCAAEEAALDRLRAEPSEESARQFWRDLQCERLRPQVRLLMESLDLTPDSRGSPPSPGNGQRHALDAPSTGNGVRGMSTTTTGAAADSGACRREAEELDRIRANPDRRLAERFALTVTCDALKPQAARLLESFAE
jgi:Caspase domain